MMKGVLIGMLLTVIVLAVGIYYYFAAGVAPAATADPPIPFERKCQPPVAVDESAYLAGAEVYKHG
jgi:hypothetical protein